MTGSGAAGRLRADDPRNPRWFVMVAHPRSGTNFLGSILNQHPRAFWAGEVFQPDPAARRYVWEKASEFQALGHGSRQARFSPHGPEQEPTLDGLDGLLGRFGQVTRREVVGFSLFSQEAGHVLTDPEVAALVLRRAVQPILLVRRNLLKAFVSLKRALATGAWHLDGSGNLVQYPNQVSRPNSLHQWMGAIDPGEAQAWIRSTARFLDQLESTLQRAGKPYLKLHYEDLCLSGQAMTCWEIDRTLAFLGLDPLREFQIQRRQTAAAEFYDAIPNRRELIDATGFDLDPPPSSPHGWIARVRLQAERWRANGRTIALAPAGAFARSLLDSPGLREVPFLALFDRDPQQPAYAGVPVRPYRDLQRIAPHLVLVASPLREDEIVQELLAQGLATDRIMRLTDLPAS